MNQFHCGAQPALSAGMKHTNMTKTTKLAAVLAIAAMDLSAQETRKRIVVSIPDRKLVLFDGDRAVKTYDVAVGKSSTPTPEGKFAIINRVPHPAWFGPAGVVPPGKNNPLGSRWMGLSVKGYGIHGTNVPSSIGQAASHGCVRMRQSDLEELFELVTVGTTVELQGEPVEVLAGL
jgi:lipoprotein-anchoring transpeptidase ErfK/SrfK